MSKDLREASLLKKKSQTALERAQQLSPPQGKFYKLLRDLEVHGQVGPGSAQCSGLGQLSSVFPCLMWGFFYTA